MEFCLVDEAEEFVKSIKNHIRHWDKRTTLPPSSLTAEQRTKFSVRVYTRAAGVPVHHHPGAITHTSDGYTVTEVIEHIPFTEQEISDQQDIELSEDMDRKFIKAMVKWVAPLVGKTVAEARDEIEVIYKALP